ncbi:MAG: 3-deoxy-8-phosphooctulonate synthase [Saprospiraceae bacterium]
MFKDKNAKMNYKDLTNKKGNFFLIAGPCVVEDDKTVFQIAEEVNELCKRLDIVYIFKASYRKANRSRFDSFKGIGDIEGLELISEVGEKFGIPTITDIHSHEEAELAASYVDVIQIPAFLSRQTDLLVAAARTGKIVNIKKGQFLSPESMQFAIDKVKKSGNNNIVLTDRGTMFGYNDLIVDFRGIPKMQKFDVPVVVDCTHSLQQPNQSSGVTGGDPEMIETICKAAIAVGVDGLFIETHPNPAIAKSDGANMLPLEKLPSILEKLVKIRKAL